MPVYLPKFSTAFWNYIFISLICLSHNGTAVKKIRHERCFWKECCCVITVPTARPVTHMLGLVLCRHSVVDTERLQKLLLKDDVAESVGIKWFVKIYLSVDIYTSSYTTDHILPEDIPLESSDTSMGCWRKSLSMSAPLYRDLFSSQRYKQNDKQYFTWLDGE